MSAQPDRISPQFETEIRSSKNSGYPKEYGSWTGRSDAFKKLAGKIPSGYTKDVLDHLDALQLASWRRGERSDDIPAETWLHRWDEVCTCQACKKRGLKQSIIENHSLSTPAIDPKEIASKLGCSVRTVQNSLSEAWEIGCLARRKVGKRYAYTLLYEDFHRVQKQAEPEAKRGPVAVARNAKRGFVSDERGEFSDGAVGTGCAPNIPTLVPDQASRFRLEFETVGGEQTAIRVVEIGRTEGEHIAQNFARNEPGALHSIESHPENPGPDIDTALRQLRTRSTEPLRYTTVCHEDYIQVTISTRKGVMPTDAPAQHRRSVGAAVGRPDHAAILAAIPKTLISKLSETPGPLLLDRIATDLQGAPLENLTAKIKSRWKAITSLGIIASLDPQGNPKGLAKDVGDAWQASQGLQPENDFRPKTAMELKMDRVFNSMLEDLRNGKK